MTEKIGTVEQYIQAMGGVLREIPLEFAVAIRAIAWERGHSCGYSEVLVEAEGLRDKLEPFIKAFEQRMRSEYMAGD